MNKQIVKNKNKLAPLLLVILTLVMMALPISAIAYGPMGSLGITLTPTSEINKPTETNTPAPTVTPQPTNTALPAATPTTIPKSTEKQSKSNTPPIVQTPLISPIMTPTMPMPNGLPSAGTGMNHFLIAGGLAAIVIATGIIRRCLYKIQ